MPGITATLNKDNHVEAYKEILRVFGGKTFNILVQTFAFGDEEPKITKLCNRSLVGSVKTNGLQVSIPLFPGGSVAWDLNVEYVVILFDTRGGEIWIQRFMNNRQKYKLMRLTVNPI